MRNGNSWEVLDEIFPRRTLVKDGALTFKAPYKKGSYDFRMFDTGDNTGEEAASVTFAVEGKFPAGN